MSQIESLTEEYIYHRKTVTQICLHRRLRGMHIESVIVIPVSIILRTEGQLSFQVGVYCQHFSVICMEQQQGDEHRYGKTSHS